MNLTLEGEWAKIPNGEGLLGDSREGRSRATAVGGVEGKE